MRSLKTSLAEIKQLVADNDKQRFSLAPLDSSTSSSSDALAVADQIDASRLRIRANQGHSIKLASETLLTPLDRENMPAVVVHGTTHAAWPRILASGGMKAMSRNHMHFATGLPASFIDKERDSTTQSSSPAAVISGMRNSSTVLIYVDTSAALDAGIKFWLSDNGVVLTEGNEKGLLPVEVFARVEDRAGLGVLVEEGKVVREAPQSWAEGKKGPRAKGHGRGRGADDKKEETVVKDGEGDERRDETPAPAAATT